MPAPPRRSTRSSDHGHGRNTQIAASRIRRAAAPRSDPAAPHSAQGRDLRPSISVEQTRAARAPGGSCVGTMPSDESLLPVAEELSRLPAIPAPGELAPEPIPLRATGTDDYAMPVAKRQQTYPTSGHCLASDGNDGSTLSSVPTASMLTVRNPITPRRTRRIGAQSAISCLASRLRRSILAGTDGAHPAPVNQWCG